MSGSYFGSLLAAKFPYHRLKELREVTNNLQEGAENLLGSPRSSKMSPAGPTWSWKASKIAPNGSPEHSK